MTEGAESHPGGLSRHFAEVGGREFHYLRTGSGPVAVLLPAFPWSAGSLAPLAEALAGEFTVVVLDLPGCGNSHSLGGPPTLGDYADAVAENLGALGIDRCHLYGTGTGAQVALEVAVHHPERVADVVLDQLPLLEDSQRSEWAERFCPRFDPSWDGTHIAAIWWWCREQSLFRPWYRPSAETRIDANEAAPGVLHRRATDVLRAGAGYDAGLRAALAESAARSLERIDVPHTLVTAADDSFTPHGARIPAPGARGDVIELPPAPDRTHRLRSIIGRGADRSLRPPEPAPVAGTLNRSYVDVGHGRWLLARRIPGMGRPLVMLHTSPASSALLEPLMREVATGRPVVALDNPANGDSDPPPGHGPFEIADFAAAVNGALARLAPGEFDLYGTHTGALIAMELAISNPRVRRLILEGVTMFDDGDRPDLLPRAELLANYLPLFEPTWDGTHLMAAWHFRRAFTTYWPWYRRTREGIRWVPMVELAAFQRSFVEVAKRLDTYHLPYRAALAYPTADRLRHIEVPTLIAAHPDDPLQAHSAEAAGLVPGGRWDALPDDIAGAAALYDEFLTGS
ncbi:MAG: alpha/beta fold hydrolase [Acidobacteria bacterium]|nr:alpha/beta fold hydrolase [Acidobacteriota bacterium]